jgi:hypothetical protein
VANPLQELLIFDEPLHHDEQVIEHNLLHVASLQELWQLLKEHALGSFPLSISAHEAVHPIG